MKKIRFLLATLVAVGMITMSCAPDKVAPTEGAGSSTPSLSGGIDDPHPRLDTICSNVDSILLMSESGQSLTINKCNAPGGMQPCSTNTPWGFVEMYSGVNFIDGTYNNGDDVEYFVVNFTVNGGFYIDRSTSQFGLAGLTFDSNGIPVIDQDWLLSPVNPVVNRWQLLKRMDELPSRCPSLALNLTVVKLNLYSQVVNNSNSSIWGYNPDWNDSQDPKYSPLSPFLTPFCAPQCLPIVVQEEDVCQNVYQGLTCNNGCTDLTPDVSGLGLPLTYNWSTGETTASINVCPTAAVTYDVTISDSNGAAAKVVHFNTTSIDVGCAIGITNDPRAKFCTANLDLKYNMTFNIRDYVAMYDGSAPDWNVLRFTYTDAGANHQTSPSDWNLAAYNNGAAVTVTSADISHGTGNRGRGQYRVYIYRLGEATCDAYINVRVNNNRSSNLASGKCNGANCGYIAGVRVCHIPPGNPGGAVTNCVTYSQLGTYINDYCTPGVPTGSSSNSGDYLGSCGGDPCQ